LFADKKLFISQRQKYLKNSLNRERKRSVFGRFAGFFIKRRRKEERVGDPLRSFFGPFFWALQCDFGF
jgi:hypothetical protein